jgi:hypothetical protein
MEKHLGCGVLSPQTTLKLKMTALQLKVAVYVLGHQVVLRSGGRHRDYTRYIFIRCRSWAVRVHTGKCIYVGV